MNLWNLFVVALDDKFFLVMKWAGHFCFGFFVCLFLSKAISLGQASVLLFVEACFHYSQVSFYQL